MSLFQVTSGINTGFKRDLNYYVFEKGVSVTKIEERKKLVSVYPNFPDEVKSCYEFSNTYIGAADIYAREFTIEENKTLFLEFCDLVVADPVELNSFISDHGFLSNYKNLSKMPVQNCRTINPHLTNKQKKQSTNIVELYGEPLSLWVLVQLRLRTLVRTWRFLKASEKNFNNSYFHLLFKSDKNQWHFNDDHNNCYEDVILDERLDNPIIENKFLDELRFNISPLIILKKESEKNEGGISSLTNKLPLELLQENFQLLNYANSFVENEINTIFSNNMFRPDLKLKSRLFKSGILSIGKSEFNSHYNSLLQTIFYQFLYAITNEIEFTRCLECQKWMEKVDQGKRGKLYCDHKCRTKAYRRRRDLKLIFVSDEQKGRLDIIKNLEQWCIALKDGKLEEFNIKLTQKSMNKEVKKIIQNTIKNTFENVVCWSTNKSVSQHLDIDEKIINLDTTREFIIQYYHFFSKMTHIDWDQNLS